MNATVTAITINEFSRNQVWNYITDNGLPVKKLSSTEAARKALIEYLEALADLDTVSDLDLDLEPVAESEYLEAPIEVDEDSIEVDEDSIEVDEDSIDDEPDLQDACDNDNDPDPDPDPEDDEPETDLVHKPQIEQPESVTDSELVTTISVSATDLIKLTDVSKISKVKHWVLGYEDGVLWASSVRGEITTTDRVAVNNVAGNWSTCVDHTFTAFAKKLKGGEFVTLDTTDNEVLKLTSDRGCLDVNLTKIDLTPESNQFDGKIISTFTTGAESLLKAIKNIAPCRSIDHHVLKSVLVKINGSTVNLVATDGSRLAVARTELLAGSVKPKTVILLPSGIVSGLAAMAGSIQGGVKATIDISKTHIRASFSNSNLQLVSHKPEDCFTNVDPVIDRMNAAEAIVLTFDTATVRDRLLMLAPVTAKMTDATVTLTLDRNGHAHIVADNNQQVADTGFQYTGTAVDRTFEFNYGFFLHGLSTGNESIELSCPIDLPLVKLATPTFCYYLAPIT
jgi:DNA polymerase III sliding clamp (beta) subunit (PCNA family)